MKWELRLKWVLLLLEWHESCRSIVSTHPLSQVITGVSHREAVLDGGLVGEGGEKRAADEDVGEGLLMPKEKENTIRRVEGWE
jgi:hypothetical protein